MRSSHPNSTAQRRLKSSIKSSDDTEPEQLTSAPPLNHEPQHFKVGNTPIFEDPELSKYFGIKHLMVKDESYNEFGTHKDRKSSSIVKDEVLRPTGERAEALYIVTAGNAGLSLACFAKEHNLRVVSFVSNKNISDELRQQLEKSCQVFYIDSTEWLQLEALRNIADDHERRVRDVSNNIIAPYQTIVDEICEDLPERERPDVIVLPFGCGELFRGIEEGLRKNGLKARLIGVTVDGITSADKLHANFHQKGMPRNMLTTALPHQILRFKNEQLLKETYEEIKNKHKLTCEPSSAVAFAALHEFQSEFGPDDKVMVINTGTSRITKRQSLKATF